MIASVEAVGPETMAAGFELAGVPTTSVATPDDAVARIAEALARPDLGVILLDDAVLGALPDAVRRHALRLPMPLIVPVPALRWKEQREDVGAYILELLQRAVGYRMRLK